MKNLAVAGTSSFLKATASGSQETAVSEHSSTGDRSLAVPREDNPVESHAAVRMHDFPLFDKSDPPDNFGVVSI